MSRIPEDIVKEVKTRASLEETITRYSSLKKSGSSRIGECPACGGKKMTYTPAKEIVKCFKCDRSAKDAVSFLVNFMDMDFRAALLDLAAYYSIDIPETQSNYHQQPFRDQQLQGSGIPLDTTRYTSNSLNEGFELVDGNDMVLHYLDLEGELIMYRSRSRKINLPYYRIRYRNPDHHKDQKTGKPIRYRSPVGSKSQLWLPDVIIDKYKSNTHIPILVICEGEKKATKLCLSGVDAVGIAGIHNFDPGKMSQVFYNIITACEVEKVVFCLDSDWQKLSTSKDRSVDSRPRSFATAVIKFKDYFYGYANEDIYLDIYFGYHKSMAHKGIDDYLVLKLKGKESELAASFTTAVTDRKGESDHVKLYKITTDSAYKIKEIWKLNNTQQFLAKHKDELRKLPGKFKIGRIEWRWNGETNDFEIAQEVMPSEEYWSKYYVNDDPRYKLNHTGARNFLKSRGFYKVRIDGQPIRFVQCVDQKLYEVDETFIRDFVLEFTESIGRNKVLEMLLASDRAFMSSKLKDMYPVNFVPLGKDKESQILTFNNQCLYISADAIETRTLTTLDGFIWDDEIIDFNLEFDKPLLEFYEEGGHLHFNSKQPKKLMKSQLFQFLMNTSDFHWRRRFELVDGKYEKRRVQRTDEETLDLNQHLVAKMIAIGYILHNYEDLSRTKAIVCMDGIEAEVGRNEGGTGKSIFSTMFEHVMKTFIIDAQSKKLTEDSFLLDGVDERTRLIVMDDCRVNLDFKFFFSKISRGTMVNPKGGKQFFAGLKKWIFNTNHSLGTSDNSTRRRQYILAFSDYYNEHRTPFDDFGCVLFHEWDKEQWNLMFNIFACCLQAYLRYGFKYGIPDDNVRKRQLRKEITEEFLEWALDYFGTPEDPNKDHVNKRVQRVDAMDDFYKEYPKSARYNNKRHFKRRMFRFCEYAGFRYNMKHDESHRIRSGSIEYFVVADDNCPTEISNVPKAFTEDGPF